MAVIRIPIPEEAAYVVLLLRYVLMILPKLQSGQWKRVLFAKYGALLSNISFNEGQTIPGIAHAVILESSKV